MIVADLWLLDCWKLLGREFPVHLTEVELLAQIAPSISWKGIGPHDYWYYSDTGPILSYFESFVTVRPISVEIPSGLGIAVRNLMLANELNWFIWAHLGLF